MMLFEQIENFPFLVLLIQKLHVDVFFSLGSSTRRLKNARRTLPKESCIEAMATLTVTKELAPFASFEP
jgi:hypothetical protein